MMINPQVKVAVAMDDGATAILAFITRSRSPTLPFGAVWSADFPGDWEREPSDANIFAEISKAFPSVDMAGIPKPQPVSYKVIRESDVPLDRSYRNAWKLDSDKIIHDMEKAKEIHLDKVRRARTAQLGELDKDWTQAMGQGDAGKAAEVEAQRQALRDAPQTLDLSKAATIEDLKATWPEGLPRL